jgi:hypothetical protein
MEFTNMWLAGYLIMQTGTAAGKEDEYDIIWSSGLGKG